MDTIQEWVFAIESKTGEYREYSDDGPCWVPDGPLFATYSGSTRQKLSSALEEGGCR